MTESKIRVFFFSLGATAVWLLLAYLVAFGVVSVGNVIGIGLIALLLTVVAMGQG